jgi:DMSO/TMAO reductase YedYZ molybdopterin-dependent catalytic subunit
MRSFVLLVPFLLFGSALRAQVPAAPAGRDVMRVEGDVPRPHAFTSADLLSMPRREVTVSDHGTTTRFQGVPLASILERAGITFGRGGNAGLTSFVLVEARDGYRILLAIAELDSALTDRVILLADRVNGVPLAPEAGPARVIITDEKRGARWIRQVARIRVTSVPE